MAKRPIQLALKMSDAINYGYGCHTVVNTKKFFDVVEGRLVTLYAVHDSVKERDSFVTKKLFQSSSSVFICYFLQELLCAFRGEPFPTPAKPGYFRHHSNTQEAIDYMLERYKDDNRQSNED